MTQVTLGIALHHCGGLRLWARLGSWAAADRVATTYLAFMSGERRNFFHLVREGAEASLCGIPALALSPRGRFDNAVVCRECIDWVPNRWTGSNPAATR